MGINIDQLRQGWQKYPMRPLANLYKGLVDVCEKSQLLFESKRHRSINVVCEIGSFAGESMVFICKTLRPGIFISIDPYSNDYDEADWASQTNLSEVETVFSDAIDYVKQEYGTIVIKIKGTVLDFSAIMAVFKIPVDMFYVDGSHSFKGVCTDLRYSGLYQKYCLLNGPSIDSYWQGTTMVRKASNPL